MCEFCGGQETAALDILTREHHAVVTLIGADRRALARRDLATTTGACRSILEVLGPHTAAEEGGVFPPLLETFGDQVRRLHQEHHRIEAVLGEVAGRAPGAGWPDRLAETLHLLRERILREQDGVFPATMAILGPDDWDRIAAIRETVGTALAPDASPGTAA